MLSFDLKIQIILLLEYNHISMTTYNYIFVYCGIEAVAFCSRTLQFARRHLCSIFRNNCCVLVVWVNKPWDHWRFAWFCQGNLYFTVCLHVIITMTYNWTDTEINHTFVLWLYISEQMNQIKVSSDFIRSFWNFLKTFFFIKPCNSMSVIINLFI